MQRSRRYTLLVKVGHGTTIIRLVRTHTGGSVIQSRAIYDSLGGEVIDRALKAQALTQAGAATGVCPLAGMSPGQERVFDHDLRTAKHTLDHEAAADVQVWTPAGIVTTFLFQETAELAANQLAAWLRDAAHDALVHAAVDPDAVSLCCLAGGPLADPLLCELLMEVMPWPVVLAQPHADCRQPIRSP